MMVSTSRAWARSALVAAGFVPAAAHARPVNAEFETDLSGWVVREHGGTLTPGTVTPDNGDALMIQGDSLLVVLEQTFVVPPRATTVSFNFVLDPGWDDVIGGVPDAFEARVLAGTVSAIPTWSPTSTAAFNLQEDGTEHVGAGSLRLGNSVAMSIADVAPGTAITVSFALVGDDAGTTSGVRIRNMRLSGVNVRPVANAGPDQVVGCVASVQLDAGASFDPDGDAITFRWTGPTGNDLGTTAQITVGGESGTYTVEVTDIYGETHTDTVTITSQDVTPPVLTVPTTPITITADGSCEAEVPDLVDLATASDDCSEPTIVQDPAAGTPLVLDEPVIVTVTATDGAGNTAEEEITVEFVDPGGLCAVVDTDSDSDTDFVTHTDTYVDTDTDTDTPTDDTDTDESDTDVATDDTDTDLPTDDTDTDESDTDDTDTDTDTDESDTDVPTDDTDTDDTDTDESDTDVPTDDTDTDESDTDVPTDDTDTDTDTDTDSAVPVETDTDVPTDDTDLPTDDSDTPVDSDTDIASGTDDTDGPKDDGGSCGCSSIGPSTTWPALALLALALRRRRRAAAAPAAAVLLALPIAARADPIVLDAATASNLSTSTEVDEWTFTAAPGSSVFVDAVATSARTQLGWSLVDAVGRVLVSDPDFDDLGRVTLMGGTYTVRIAGDGTGTPTYTLRVHSSPNVDEGTLPLNTPVSVVHTGGGESHSWTFDATEGLRVALDVSAVTSSPHLGWSLTDEAGLAVVPITTNFADAGPFTLRAGRWTLTTQSRNDVVQTYAFSLGTPDGNQGGTLTLGAPVTSEITAPFEVDNWTFSVASPTTVSVLTGVTSNPGALNWRLLDGAGLVVGPQVTTFVGDGPVRLTAGEWTLRVLGEGANIGSYSLVVDEPGELVSSLVLDAPTTWTFTHPSQRARATFSAAAGTTVVFDVTAGADTLWGLRLLTATGEEVVPLTTDVRWRTPTTLVGGDYVLELVPEGNTTGALSGVLRTVVSDSGSTALGSSLSGAITSPGSTWSRTFTVPAGQQLNVVTTATNNRFGLNSVLTDSVGREVLPRSTELNGTRSVALLGGTYTLTVLGETEVIGTFAIDLVDAGTSTFVPPVGTPLVLGTPVSTTLGAAAVSDVYTLEVATPTRIFADLITGASGLTWTLRDGAGTALWTSQRAQVPNGTDDRGAWWLAPDTYTLTFDHATTTPAYGFVLHAVPAPTTTPIVLDETVVSALTVPGEQQSFGFTLAESTDVFLNLLTGSTNLEWSLTDAAGQVWRGPQRALVVTSDDFGRVRLPAGDWQITFGTTSDDVGPFSFEVVEVLDEGFALTLGTPAAGAVAMPGQVQSWTFDLTDTTEVVFDVIAASTTDMRWRLIDAEGTQRFEGRAGVPSTDDLGPFALVPGSWTVELRANNGNTGTATFAATALDLSATSISLDDTAVGSLAAGGEQALFTLTLDGAHDVYVDLLVGNGELRWSLLDDVGSAVFEGATANTPGSQSQGPFPLSAGTWTLRLWTRANTAADYSFVARDVITTFDVARFGRESSGTLSGPGATARYDLTVPSDGIAVSAAMRSGTARQDWRLVDEVGQPVWGWLPAEDTNDDVAAVPLVKGNYSLQFDADFSFVTAWAFTLNGDAPEGVDVCDAAVNPEATDCDEDGVVDACQATEAQPDCNSNFALDSCELAQGGDCDANGLPDDCYDCPLIEIVFVMDTSASMVDESVSLCNSLLTASATLLDQGIAIKTHLLSIDGIPVEFPCLTNNVTTLYGTTVPLDPPAAYDTLAQCNKTAGNLEDWAAAVSVVSAQHPWQPGAGRVIVPISDEGPVCGDPYLAGEEAAVSHLITVARAFDVQVHPISGTGSSGPLLEVFEAVATSTGGIVQRSTTNPVEYVTFLTTIAQDACRDLFDCDRDDVPDSCQIANGEIPECACGRIPDTCQCDGPPTITQLQPAPGTRLVPGSTVVVSGTATSSEPGQTVAAVLVNGRAVASVDPTGRFFASIVVEPGEQSILIEAIDRCGEGSTTLDWLGDASGLPGQTEDVSASVQAKLRNTTWSTDTLRLSLEAAAENTSDSLLGGPLLLVPGPELSENVTLSQPDGWTDDGYPYLQLLDVHEALEPDALSLFRGVSLDVPALDRPHFRPTWRVAVASTPTFSSVPGLWVRAGQTWRYDADAQDPTGATIRFSAPVAPPGLAIDPSSGLLSWTTTEGNEGFYDITVVADNGRGGRASQRFVLEVRPVTENTPPLFTAPPPTYTPVGAPFAWTAMASDEDGDALSFTKDLGPAGLVVATNGAVSWPAPERGVHTVALTVSDGRGGTASLSWSLFVGEAPTSGGTPRILTTPPDTVAAYTVFVYQPGATDPDQDVLSWRLDDAPATATIDDVSGRISWAPAPGDVGTVDFAIAVTDPAGNEASQRWTVRVLRAAFDRSPVFSTEPTPTALAGSPWTYDATAIDPEGLAVTYGKDAGPGDLTVGSASGVATWTPSLAEVGEHTVSITASDPGGGTTVQAFTLLVRGTNAAPVISSGAPSDAVVGSTWSYDLNATDADGDRLAYALTSAPDGMTMASWSGATSWLPSEADLGSHTVAVRVSDTWGGVATRSYTVRVVPDTQAPTVSLRLSGEAACLDEPFQVCVGSSDNSRVVSRALTADGVPVDLDGAACAWLDPSELGTIDLVASALDGAGNEGTDLESLRVVDCNDLQAPVVTLISPAPGTALFAPTPLVVDIDDNTPASLAWTVEWAPAGTQAWIPLASGTGAVDGAQVALLDTTSIPNGDWDIRVLAEDGAQSGGFQGTWGVGGDHKLADLRVSFTDLVLSLEGVPIAISRTYDSLSTLDPKAQDFGPGWSMSLMGKVWDTPVEAPESAAFALLQNGPFLNESRVTVMKPNGDRVGFTFRPEPKSFPAAFQYSVVFEADPGVQDTLEPVDATLNVWNLGAGYADYIIPWNPSRWALTTPEGVRYVYDEVDGLVSVEDAYGNTLTVTRDGVVHSDGTRVDFQRDPSGRVTAIIPPDPDPNDGRPGPTLRYDYDGAGRLVAFRNGENEAVTYDYDAAARPTLLTDIHDPTGRPILRTIYDAEGRVTAQCPAEGDPITLIGCSTLSVDAEGGVASVVSARGFATDLFYDAAGNLSLERRYLDGLGTLDTAYTWDARRNQLTRTVNGATWTTTYDDQDRVLSTTAPHGAIERFTYEGDCPQPSSRTDALGATERFTYDDDCGLIEVVDRLGRRISATRNRGRITQITDAEGQIWRWSYGRFGPTRLVDATTRATDWTYDQLGRVTSQLDRTGRRRSWTYDDADRKLSEAWDTVPAVTLTYTWDDGGRLLSGTSPDAIVSRTYTPMGQIATEVVTPAAGGAPTVLTFTYDGAGNVSTVDDGMGGTWTWEADERNAMVGASLDDPRAPVLGVARTLDAHGRPVVVERRLGASVVGSTLSTYDAGGGRGRLTALDHRAPADAALLELAYVRDARSNVRAVTDDEGVHRYGLDSVDQLLTADHPVSSVVVDEAHAWDAAGNRTSSVHGGSSTFARPSPGGHALVSDGLATYTYDANGALTERVSLTDGSRLELDHDPRGLVVALRSYAPGGALTQTVLRRHDALSRLVEVVENGVRTGVRWDRGQPFLEVDASGAATVRRLYGARLDEVLAEVGTDGPRWYLTDAVGTVRKVLDGDGTTLATPRFDSFGRPFVPSPTALGFAGLREVGVGGLLDARIRLYDPSTGRFVSEDPFAPFRYTYANGNPTLLRDPTGATAAIEYACMAAESAGFAIGYGEDIGIPLKNFFEGLARFFEGLGPPDDGSGIGAGLASWTSGLAGIPEWPEDPGDVAETLVSLGCTASEYSGD